MRIFICTMDDPVYTLPFIKEIIQARQVDIVGLAVSKGDRLTIGKRRSKMIYLLSLILIMGPIHFTRYSTTEVFFKLKKKLSRIFPFIKSPSILQFAQNMGIPVFNVKTVNNQSFLEELLKLKPDIIINQAQNILKNEFLSVPKIGVINRHNALLPKNRGRLTPFWVLYKGEKETGVSIHFVNEKIDEGDIIVQKRFPISKQDNFNTIVKKNYQIAPKAMLEALAKLEKSNYDIIKNDNNLATYNSIPTFRYALDYRLKRMKKVFSSI